MANRPNVILFLVDQLSAKWLPDRRRSCGGAAADRSSSTPTSNSVRVHCLSLHPKVYAECEPLSPAGSAAHGQLRSEIRPRTILVPLQLQFPTALPGLAVRHRKYLELPQYPDV
jgi:hypothetical protein